jgi:hypothetical protein
MAIVSALSTSSEAPTLYDVPEDVLQQYKMDVQPGQGGQQVSPQSDGGLQKDQPGSGDGAGASDVQAYGELCRYTARSNGHLFGWYGDCDTDERLSPIYHLCNP